MIRRNHVMGEERSRSRSLQVEVLEERRVLSAASAVEATPLAEETPWANKVSVIEPLAQHPAGEARLGLSPVARNGENRWIMLIERVVRDQGGVT